MAINMQDIEIDDLGADITPILPLTPEEYRVLAASLSRAVLNNQLRFVHGGLIQAVTMIDHRSDHICLKLSEVRL